MWAFWQFFAAIGGVLACRLRLVSSLPARAERSMIIEREPQSFAQVTAMFAKMRRTVPFATFADSWSFQGHSIVLAGTSRRTTSG